MSGDKDNEYFSDGISEELLNVLVRVDGLGVASRTSSFAYKGSPLGTAAIASALKVNHVLEGSVRKAGNQVRITAQLIDAVNDRHLWSETYDRELTDIFAIQEEIANSIVNALRDELGPAQAAALTVKVRADTENLEAYQLYLKARELFIARRELPESMRLFEQVTQLDPGFARGWEGLAAMYVVAPSWGIVDRDYAALAKSAAARALKLDPTLSMPWAALAAAEQRTWPVDWGRNFELFDRAIAADAHNGTAFLWRGQNWVIMGFLDRAIADFERCLALDPQYLNCARWKAVALLYEGQTDQAMKLFEQGVAAGMVTNRATTFIVPLVRRGDRVGATLLLRELGASPAVIARVLQSIERPTPVPQAELDALVRDVTNAARPGDQTVGLSPLHLWLGQYDRISETGESVWWDPAIPQFRKSAAFKRILAPARLSADVPGRRRDRLQMRLNKQNKQGRCPFLAPGDVRCTCPRH
jgi:TolB-like protein